MPLPKGQREYTYKDYLHWPEDERLEIIEGQVYSQATPSPIHQKIVGNLYFQLHKYFEGKECTPFVAPFTVRLPLDGGETDEKQNKNIVEPDLSVVCDKSKLDKSGYSGAPTLIVEIVSKSSVKRDNVLKLNKYQQAGVKEYWIITPETESITRSCLNEQGHYNTYDMYVLGEDEEISSKIFADLTIKLKDVFATWGIEG